jgi:hypothetical protein
MTVYAFDSLTQMGARLKLDLRIAVADRAEVVAVGFGLNPVALCPRWIRVTDQEGSHEHQIHRRGY